MATINEIKQQAAAVKNATQVGENTAERVGGALAGLSEIAEQQDSKLSDLSNNLKSYAETTENKEYKSLLVDKEDNIIESIDNNDVKHEYLKKHIHQDIIIDGDINNQKIDKIQSDILELEYLISDDSNPEFAEMLQDIEGKIIEGTRKDGTKVFGGDVETKSVDIVSSYNPEFAEMVQDAEGKILEGTRKDGTKYINTLQVENLTIGNQTNKAPKNSILELNPKNVILPIMRSFASQSHNATWELESVKPLVISYMGDIHNHKNNVSLDNFKRFCEFNSYYKDYIKDVFLNGDIVGGNFPDFGKEMKSVEGWETMLKSIGNHDAEQATSLEIYNQLFDTIGSWNVIQPDGASENGLLYYYKDFTEQKIRLIVLFQTSSDSEIAWLNTSLDGARALGYSVICAQHIPVAGNVDMIECPFCSPNKYPYGNDADATLKLKAVDDFIDNGGDFICWLHGHTHTDYICTTSSTVSKHKQLLLIVGAGMISELWQDTRRVKGEKSQDLFDILSFDTIYKQIKILRIGAEWSIYGQHKTTLVIDYKDKKVLNY